MAPSKRTGARGERVEVDLLIREASALGPLPPTATRLAGIVSRERFEIDEAVEIVVLDPGLAGRVLRIANSAALATRVPVSDVRHAAMRIGAAGLFQIAMATAVRGHLEQPLPALGIGEGALWRHSVAAALAVERLAHRLGRRLPPETFTAALLHDLGKIVLYRRLGPSVIGWLERAKTVGGSTALAAEKEALGVHHGELGGLIVRSWGLSDVLRLAVAHHHEPEATGDEVATIACAAVSLADAVAKRIGAGLAGADVDEDEEQRARELAGVAEPDLAAVRGEVAQSLDAVLSAYR
jgi:putative nucleotidyltransferase with HDIG domain